MVGSAGCVADRQADSHSWYGLTGGFGVRRVRQIIWQLIGLRWIEDWREAHSRDSLSEAHLADLQVADLHVAGLARVSVLHGCPE